ncbi:MAG: ATP-binding protein, partial [Deltaproteobacteria bacterium]
AEKLPEGDPNGKAARIIVEEVARLEDILRIMLRSIEPVTMQFGEVDLASVVAAVLATHLPEITTRNIKLEKFVSDDLPSIIGDEDLLLQGLDSLVEHCILMTPEGGRFSVKLEKEQDWVVIIFEHRAIGMSEEDLDQFFLPRLPFRESKRVLDLPLSRVIVNKHGGRIDVFQRQGDMITLKIVLPVQCPLFHAEPHSEAAEEIS